MVGDLNCNMKEAAQNCIASILSQRLSLQTVKSVTRHDALTVQVILIMTQITELRNLADMKEAAQNCIITELCMLS